LEPAHMPFSQAQRDSSARRGTILVAMTFTDLTAASHATRPAAGTGRSAAGRVGGPTNDTN